MQKAKSSILIVDDDVTFGKAMKEAFVRAGYEVHLCHHPKEAHFVIKVHNIAGAVVDCMLPQQNGVDLVKELRKHWGDSETPVVLISGIFTNKAFAKEASQNTQAISFFAKPFEMQSLIDIFNGEL